MSTRTAVEESVGGIACTVVQPPSAHPMQECATTEVHRDADGGGDLTRGRCLGQELLNAQSRNRGPVRGFVMTGEHHNRYFRTSTTHVSRNFDATAVR